MAELPYQAYTERMVGEGHPTLAGTNERALRALLSQSGYDPDADPFPGLMGPVFNLLSHGGAGDGGTSNVIPLNEAIAAANAGGGGIVYVPPTTSFYDLDGTVTLLPNVRIVGGSVGTADKSRFRWTGGDSTAFYFEGAAETEGLNVTFERIEIDSANAGVGYGVRGRNFDQLIFRDCAFNHLDKGVFADWGQQLQFFHTFFVLNTRGIDIGGDRSQTTTPVPGAGIRGGAFAPDFMDDVIVMGCSFSQNQVDINHCGSQYSLGGLWLAGNKFFESGASPVAGKEHFVHVSGLKSALVERNNFESPNVRSILTIDEDGLDAETNGPNFGVVVRHNSFLATSGDASNKAIDVVRGQAFIDANTFECGAGSKPINLADTTSQSYVGYNHYLTFNSGTNPTEGFTNPINIAGAPSLGHLGYASATTFKTRQIDSTFGKVFSDAATVAAFEFMLAGVRKAGFSVTAADQIRVYNSSGTVVGYIGAAFVPAQSNLGSGTSFTPNTSLGNSFLGTLNGAATLNAPVGMVQAGQRITFTAIQDGTGGRTLAFNAVFKVSWSDTGNTPGTRSSISFIWDGTNWNQDGAQTPYV